MFILFVLLWGELAFVARKLLRFFICLVGGLIYDFPSVTLALGGLLVVAVGRLLFLIGWGFSW